MKGGSSVHKTTPDEKPGDMHGMAEKQQIAHVPYATGLCQGTKGTCARTYGCTQDLQAEVILREDH